MQRQSEVYKLQDCSWWPACQSLIQDVSQDSPHQRNWCLDKQCQPNIVFFRNPESLLSPLLWCWMFQGLIITYADPTILIFCLWWHVLKFYLETVHPLDAVYQIGIYRIVPVLLYNALPPTVHSPSMRLHLELSTLRSDLWGRILLPRLDRAIGEWDTSLS